jgi:DNA-directed RNA polymerase specialized sigma24 family protein
VTRAEEFEQLRPLLFAIAYRILGSVAEAEDAVQDTRLRFEVAATQPRSTKAFRSAMVTRISIDVLRSARVRRGGVRRALLRCCRGSVPGPDSSALRSDQRDRARSWNATRTRSGRGRSAVIA